MTLETFWKEAPDFERAEDYTNLQEKIERRQTLNGQWSDLFGEQHDIEFKYPPETRYKDGKLDSDHSFITDPADLARNKELEEGMKSIERERENLDKDILEMQFELGIEAVDVQVKKGNSGWKKTKESEVPFQGKTIIYGKEWKLVTENELITVEMGADARTSIRGSLRGMADAIGDKVVLERLKQWPEERKIPFESIDLTFKVESRKPGYHGKNVEGSFRVTKSFGFEESDDKYDAGIGSDFNAYAFPTISDEKKAHAINLACVVAKQLGLDLFAEAK